MVDEVGSETDYEVFRKKIIEKKEKNGKDRPSYAIYDVEFELDGGEGKRYIPRDFLMNSPNEWQVEDRIHYIHQPRRDGREGKFGSIAIIWQS